MAKLKDRIAVVTGGASGIGRAAVRKLAREGAAIVIADIDLAGAEVVARAVEADGARAIPVACDVRVEADIAAAVAAAVDGFGRIDIMFNNAAALPQEIMVQDIDILTIATDAWDDLMAGVLRNVMLGCRYAVLAMRKTGGGSIINTSSMYGVSAFNRHPGYGTAKAGVIMLSQYVATAFGREGIRCNVIAPSMVRTDLLERTAPEPLIRLNADSVLLPALGTPEDIADIVAFLASDESRYLTGHLFRADGGTTAHLPTYSDAAKFYDSIEG